MPLPTRTRWRRSTPNISYPRLPSKTLNELYKVRSMVLVMAEMRYTKYYMLPEPGPDIVQRRGATDRAATSRCLEGSARPPLLIILGTVQCRDGRCMLTSSSSYWYYTPLTTARLTRRNVLSLNGRNTVAVIPRFDTALAFCFGFDERSLTLWPSSY